MWRCGRCGGGGENTSRKTCSCNFRLITVAPQLECFFGLPSSLVLVPLSSPLGPRPDSIDSSSRDGEGALVETRNKFSGMICLFCSNTTCGNDGPKAPSGRCGSLPASCSEDATCSEGSFDDPFSARLWDFFFFVFQVTFKTPIYLEAS
jgi:hypothetical protein